MFQVPAGKVEGKDVVCGYLTVPEIHAQPDGPTIQLAVAIIKSKDPNPSTDPLVMAQGGPGGSTIDTYTKLLLSNNRLLSNRDIVLFDQRGTLYSKPALMCKEVDQITLDTIEKQISPDQSNQLSEQALQACHQRLAQEGINLSAFNSLENAADIQDLRQALGYDQINLYGVSYGTLLALHTMAQNPQGLRSVILDSVVPPQTNFILNAAQTENRSFSHLFTACQQDPSCNKDYPDLDKVYSALFKSLNQNPAHVPMTDPDSGKTYNAVVDGYTFQDGLFQMIYATDLIPALPRMIYDAKNGKFDFFTRIMEIFAFDRTMAYGMYYSVLCAEDANFTPADQNLTGVRPEIVSEEKSQPESMLHICKNWNVQQLGPQAVQPVTSDIPTLILTGDFDPITPPDYAKSAATTLKNSFLYEFPSGGHGEATDGPCQASILQAFLDNPTKPPDGSCINKISKPSFFTPSSIVGISGLIPLLNLQGTGAIKFLTLLLSLLFLLSAVIVFPTAWIVRLVQRKSSTQPFLARFGGLLAALEGLVFFLFVAAFTVMMIKMVNANDNRIFFGVPGQARSWFILPWLAVLFSIGMWVIAIAAWLNRYWNVWMRLYYSLLALSGLVGVLLMAGLGLLVPVV